MKEIQFNKSTDLYNLILGGLIALTSDQYIGKVTYRSVSENIFLGKWLKKAKKQKRYPRSVATEIDSLIELYSIEGRNADLAALFYQMFSEFKMLKHMSQNDELSPKTRFDNAMSELAKDGWHISLPIIRVQNISDPYRPKHDKEIFTTKWHWDGAFNAKKELTKLVSIFIVSPPQDVVDCLYLHGFILIKGSTSIDDDGKYYYQYKIFPNNKCIGDAAIPTKYQY
jgi:hypothetical protein